MAPPQDSALDKAFGVLNSPGFTTVVIFMTLYLLFGSDIKLVTTTARQDFPFEVVSSVCFFFLLIELIVRAVVETDVAIEDLDEETDGEDWKTILNGDASSVKRRRTSAVHALHRLVCCGRRRTLRVRGYAYSYLFFLDLVSVASIIPEIPWFVTAVSGNVNDEASNNLSTARASRISRVGSRLGRLIRMARLVRLFRFATVWQRWRLAKNASSEQHGMTANERWRTALQRQSQMGARLHGAVTGGVILLVLLMLMVLPALSISWDDPSIDIATRSVHSLASWRGPGWEASVVSLLSSMAVWSADDNVLQQDVGSPRLLYASFTPGIDVSQPAWLPVDYPGLYNDVRLGLQALVGGEELVVSSFKTTASPAAGGPPQDFTTTLYFSERAHVRVSAAMTIALTIIVILMLAFGALQLSADAQALVLRPIESMIVFLQKASMDPLGKVSSRDNTGMYETKVLENTIKKVGTLLTVAFGSEGALVVSKHLDPVDPEGRKELTRTGSLALLHTHSMAAGMGLGRHSSGWSFPHMLKHSGSGTGQFGHGHGLGAGSPEAKSPGGSTLGTSHSGYGLQSLGGPWLGMRPGSFASYGPGGAHAKADGAQSPQVYRSQNTLALMQRSSLPLHSVFDPLVTGRAVEAVVLTVRIAHCDAITDILGPASVSWRNRVLKLVHDVIAAAGGTQISTEEQDTFQFMWSRTSPKQTGLRLRRWAEDSGAAGPGAGRRERRASLGATITGIDASALLSVQASGSTKPPSILQKSVRHLMSAPASARGEGSSRAGKGTKQPSPTTGTGTAGAPEIPQLHAETGGIIGCHEALIAALRIVTALRRSRDVHESPEQASLRTTVDLAGHRPRLEMGLHVGPAVECGLGSGHRSCVSLLGPAAVVSRSLASLAPHYGTEVLLSHEASAKLGPALSTLVRLVDDVQSVGQVYSLDCWDWSVSLPPRDLQTLLTASVLPVVATDATFGPNVGHGQHGTTAAVGRGADMKRHGGKDGLPPSGQPTKASRALVLSHAPDPRGIDARVARTWLSASALLTQHMSLPPFAAYSNGAGRVGHSADALGMSADKLEDAARAVSILGATDIVECPLRPLPAVSSLDQDPQLWPLRIPYPPHWPEKVTRVVSSARVQPWMLASVARLLSSHARAALVVPTTPAAGQLGHHVRDITGSGEFKHKQKKAVANGHSVDPGGSLGLGTGLPSLVEGPLRGHGDRVRGNGPEASRLTHVVGADLDLATRALLPRVLKSQ